MERMMKVTPRPDAGPYDEYDVHTSAKMYRVTYPDSAGIPFYPSRECFCVFGTTEVVQPCAHVRAVKEYLAKVTKRKERKEQKVTVEIKQLQTSAVLVALDANTLVGA